MSRPRRRIRFDRYLVDLHARELSYDGRKVPLQEKPFRLLVALLEASGDVVARSELYDALWPHESWVDREAGLNTAVRKLRAALVESSGQELVETVPRVGYRLLAEPHPRALEAFSSPVPDARPELRRVARLPKPLGALGLAIVAAILLLARSPGSPEAAFEPFPESPELRALYVEARGLLGVNGNLPRARHLLETLAEAAPEFAPAHAYLAEASARMAWQTGEASDVAIARRAARRTLELDPASAVAHRSLGMIALGFDWDLPAARRSIARALELAPDDPITHLSQATYDSILGRHETAVTAARRAIALAPESMAVRSDAGYFLLRAGRYREAAAECEMVLRLEPDREFGRACLVTAYAQDGRPDRARPHVLHLMELHGASETALEGARTAADPHRAYMSWMLELLLASPDPQPVTIALCYLALGQEEPTLDWLERAAQARDHLLVLVPRSARFARFRGKARYERLLRRTGLNALTRS